MTERLAAKPGAGAVAVTIGDMRTTRVPGDFTLAYLVANTIMNSPPKTTSWRSSPTRPLTWNRAGASWWR
jgi:hypothetical protein